MKEPPLRKIPIYDISDLEEIKSHIFEWRGFVRRDNAEHFCEVVRRRMGCTNPIQHLEISQNSPTKFGKGIRTASLRFKKQGDDYFSESVYQGSKVFSRSGPQHQLYEEDGEIALKTKSQWKGRKIIGVNLFGTEFPTESLSDLHDIVYWLGLENTVKGIDGILKAFDQHGVYYFTDSFDSPGKNSQSKSFASYFWRFRRGERVWDHLSEDQEKMIETLGIKIKIKEKV